MRRRRSCNGQRPTCSCYLFGGAKQRKALEHRSNLASCCHRCALTWLNLLLSPCGPLKVRTPCPEKPGNIEKIAQVVSQAPTLGHSSSPARPKQTQQHRPTRTLIKTWPSLDRESTGTETWLCSLPGSLPVPAGLWEGALRCRSTAIPRPCSLLYTADIRRRAGLGI